MSMFLSICLFSSSLFFCVLLFTSLIHHCMSCPCTISIKMSARSIFSFKRDRATSSCNSTIVSKPLCVHTISIYIFSAYITIGIFSSLTEPPIFDNINHKLKIRSFDGECNLWLRSNRFFAFNQRVYLTSQISDKWELETSMTRVKWARERDVLSDRVKLIWRREWYNALFRYAKVVVIVVVMVGGYKVNSREMVRWVACFKAMKISKANLPCPHHRDQ